MSLGSRIKFLRKSHKLTQQDIATKLEMGRSNFGHIENDRVVPTSGDLQKIADILDTTTDYLLGRTDIESRTSGNLKDSVNPYSLTRKEEKDIAVKLENMMNDLTNDSSLAFMGEPMDEEDRELLRISLENTLRMSKQMAKKKFTPKKHRK
ncbi:helix-turn-helix domain-containing protein [Brevibacillus fortis]|uniref:helix-turn-helix domain-containing protein n=1 Tax=Brevibacillus fortis TaxID=2126352 RepID=UPI0038FCDB02